MLGALLEAIGSVFIQLVVMYKWIIIISALLSWVRPDPNNSIIQILNKLTEPVYDFVRKKVPTIVGGLDLAPLIVIFALIFVEAFLVSLIY